MDPRRPALLQQRGSNPQPRPSEGRALSKLSYATRCPGGFNCFPGPGPWSVAQAEDTTHTAYARVPNT